MMSSRGSQLLCCALLLPAAFAGPPEFEVAAVAPCGQSNTYRGYRLVLSCFTLVEILRKALDLHLGTQKREVKGLEPVKDPKSRPRPGRVLNSGAPFDLEPGQKLTAARVSTMGAAWIKAPFRTRTRGRVHNRSGPEAGGIT
jgi:hypothetical protein